jgi:hypothetical protein
MLIVRIDDQFLNISLAPDVFSKVPNYFEFHKESDDGDREWVLNMKVPDFCAFHSPVRILRES